MSPKIEKSARGGAGRPQEPREAQPIYFFSPGGRYGELCQWYRCSFFVTKGEIARLIDRPIPSTSSDEPASQVAEEEPIYFNCAEQFMMYCKAGRFLDDEIQYLIMATSNPKDQKALGRGTRGFTDESWDEVKSEVVTTGNMAKFGQNESLRRMLLGTDDRLLAEASGKDRVWGIGYKEHNAGNHRGDWGENRLGKALMAVREHLRREMAEGEGST